jgi:plastocyanin
MKTVKFQSILLEMNGFLTLPTLFILSFFGAESFGDTLYDVTILPGSSNPSVNGFEPATLSIPIGATVKWTNEDFTLHTVTSGSASGGEVGTIFDSSYMAGGKTFQWTFNNAGTFEYYCTLHPFMNAKLIVVNSPTPPVTSNMQVNQINMTNPNNSNELKSQQTNVLLNATANATLSAMDEAKDILSTASNVSANATGELMTKANNVLGLASDAASNATETAMNKTMNILANISSNVSNSPTIGSSPVTVATMTNYSSNLYQIQFQYPSVGIFNYLLNLLYSWYSIICVSPSFWHSSHYSFPG